jgi:hypothetical protein
MAELQLGADVMTLLALGALFTALRKSKVSVKITLSYN